MSKVTEALKQRRASSPQPPQRSLVQDHGFKVPPPPQSEGGLTVVDIKEAVEEIFRRHSEDKIKNFFEIHRRSNALPFLPVPQEVQIPDTLSPEDYPKYATEYITYRQTVEDLKVNYLLPEKLHNIKITLFCYLYNTQTMKPDLSGHPEDFYYECVEKAPRTIKTLEATAQSNNQTLESLLREKLLL